MEACHLQVAAIAESTIGRESFALVQVRIACALACWRSGHWRALHASSTISCVCLQGPPGTGKTSSTIGIISALLARAAPSEYADNQAAWLDADLPPVQVRKWLQSL
jgi:hypothetical protein